MAITRITAPAITGLTIPNTSINNASLNSVTALPSAIDVGKVGQVVSVTKTDTFTYSGTGLIDVTGLSLTITPSATSSKIYLVANINIDASSRYTAFKFVRDSTDIGIGNAEGIRGRVTVSSGRNSSATLDNYMMHNSSASFLDSPNTTSSTVFKIQAGNTYGSQTLYINRPEFDDNNSYIHRGISTLTATEILA